MSFRKRKSILDISERHLRRLIKNESSTELVSDSRLVLQPNDFASCSASSDRNSVYHNEDYDSFENQTKASVDGIESDENQFDVDGIDSDENQFDTNEILYSNDQPSIENENVQSLQADLRCWATKHKIKRCAVSDLLTLLRKNNLKIDLPKDSRTLLKTPRQTFIQALSPGYYCHFNITAAILSVLEKDFITYKFKEIRLKIGIDGLPISDSNSSQLWPILGCVYPTSRIFLIGVYHGYTKPADSNQFLKSFVDDISNLKNGR